jgi:cation diffusion facilitator family transporter
MHYWESIDRFIDPVVIAFDQAILVAVLGLIVNGASWLILNFSRADYGHDFHDHRGGDREYRHDAHHDHNLRAAYLHVLADALTSFLAIFALLAAKYLGLVWVDPLMGIIGAVLVSRWSLRAATHDQLDPARQTGPRARADEDQGSRGKG